MKNEPMKIDIIGAGIGGLTTALALQKKGIAFRLFEQAKSIQAVGAGILLGGNAMQVFEKLGLRQQIEQLGNPVSRMQITRPNLEPITSMELDYFEKKYGVKSVAIHRSTLQGILLEALPKQSVHLDKKLTQVTNYDPLFLQFSDGTLLNSAAVIGADGIHSPVRQMIFHENTIRHTGQICWRGVTDFPMPWSYEKELTEAWGQGDRFGFAQIAPGKIYWFAVSTNAPGASGFNKQKIMSLFNNYHPLVKTLIDFTPESHIHTSMLADLKPISTWVQDRICLLGDAAHATTPNLGQGACQAIEDAYILAECLDLYPVEEAFLQYEKARMEKAQMVVRSSWTMGKVAHLENPWLVKLRNWLMHIIPKAVNRRQSDQLYRLSAV
ncbi:MAG: FAD-dependent monooxygenase [Lewinella sp.]|nr:FAD-dependent monooxygenase [Lewinella sp.]